MALSGHSRSWPSRPLLTQSGHRRLIELSRCRVRRPCGRIDLPNDFCSQNEIGRVQRAPAVDLDLEICLAVAINVALDDLKVALLHVMQFARFLVKDVRSDELESVVAAASLGIDAGKIDEVAVDLREVGNHIAVRTLLAVLRGM